MYQITKNNYHIKPKNSNIYTPKEVSEFIFKLLSDKLPMKKGSLILDPCCGQGSLLKPWKEDKYHTFGVDIDSKNEPDLPEDFFTLRKGFSSGFHFVRGEQRCFVNVNPNLILCNPPFNGYYPKLAPEVWLDKIIELFGKEAPIILFVPAGFCLNMTLKSKRHEKFENGTYPPISSRITLPKNIFSGVTFHSEILIFNIKGLEPHYFYQEKKYE